MAKHGRRRGTCIFCGQLGLLTREDATPRWLSGYLRQHLPPQPSWEAVEMKFDSRGHHSERLRPADSASLHKVMAVCASCNNGWMSRLETKASTFLKPLIIGQPLVLKPAALTTLATWATKTALVYEFVQSAKNGTTASGADRESFSTRQEPFPTSRIWMAQYAGTRGTVVIARSTLFLYDLDDRSSVPEAHGLMTVLVFGRLALRVALVRDEPRYPTRFALTERPTTPSIWPEPEALTWPPSQPLDDAGLNEFMSLAVPRTGPGAFSVADSRLTRPSPSADPSPAD
jgi:hypothetical protein